jgi:hypothetical protein
MRARVPGAAEMAPERAFEHICVGGASLNTRFPREYRIFMRISLVPLILACDRHVDDPTRPSSLTRHFNRIGQTTTFFKKSLFFSA